MIWMAALQGQISHLRFHFIDIDGCVSIWGRTNMAE
jgi:hypothetical protein